MRKAACCTAHSALARFTQLFVIILHTGLTEAAQALALPESRRERQTGLYASSAQAASIPSIISL